MRENHGGMESRSRRIRAWLKFFKNFREKRRNAIQFNAIGLDYIRLGFVEIEGGYVTSIFCEPYN